MNRCAVVGFPIAHSRSPILHLAAYAALGLGDWTYDRVELRAEELAGWLLSLDASWQGVSVTMPVKAAALASADTATELASTLGAANTLLRTEGGWRADNTDVAGLLGALAESGIDSATAPSTATIVGGGGTASAAVAALAALGLSTLGIVVRDPARAHALLALVDRLGMSADVHPWPGTPPEGAFSGESAVSAATEGAFSGESAVGEAPLGADLVISTVPASATSEFLGHRWRPDQTLLDVTYDPWPTALIDAAAGHGAQVIDGTAVLLWQAVGQVELITGRRAPVERMRAALLPGGSLAPA